MPSDREILEGLDTQCAELVKKHPESNEHMASMRIKIRDTLAQIDQSQEGSEQSAKDVIANAEPIINAFVAFYENGPDTVRKQA